MRADFSKISVLVIGDLILDKYVSGSVERISPEAPVPVLVAHQEKMALGGASNVANNLSQFTRRVYLSGIVGEDVAGHQLESLIREAGIHYRGVTIRGRPTTVKTRFMSNQHILRVDWECDSKLGSDYEQMIIDELANQIPNVIVVSDYNKGTVTSDIVKHLISYGRPIIIDPKPENVSCYSGADYITPNKSEAEKLSGIRLRTLDDLPNLSKAILTNSGCSEVIITLGENGMFHYGKDSSQLYPTSPKEVYDVTGAGDTVVAMLALGIACGWPISQSISMANYAAGIVVEKWGTAVVRPSDLEGWDERK